jgi:hypothetical protein
MIEIKTGTKHGNRIQYKKKQDEEEKKRKEIRVMDDLAKEVKESFNNKRNENNNRANRCHNPCGSVL